MEILLIKKNGWSYEEKLDLREVLERKLMEEVEKLVDILKK